MQLVRQLNNYQSKENGIALSIGNFDGVHKGHRSVIKFLLDKSKELNIPSGIMCFEPQPLEFFQSIKIPARLSRFRDKFVTFKELGVDKVFCLNFNKELAKLSPCDFVKKYLVEKLNIKYLVVGDDFRFGVNGKGDFELLKKLGSLYGFNVVSMESFLHDEERISSTAIRNFLSKGLLEKAKSFLGSDYYISGKISYGQQIGRTIGFPTANINLKRRVIPLYGVYIVRIDNIADKPMYGMANVGSRPTVNGVEPRLEVYIFDFNGELYHKELKVVFLSKLRDEKKFNSLDELVQQLKIDEQSAREYLKYNKIVS